MERPRYRFSREQRLRKSLDFEQVYERGIRAGDAHLLVFALPNGTAITRLGVSVSRKHGSAVVRNLKRRRLKEAFRRLQHDLPSGLDIIIVPRQRLDSELADYSKSLMKLIRRLTTELGLNST